MELIASCVAGQTNCSLVWKAKPDLSLRLVMIKPMTIWDTNMPTKRNTENKKMAFKGELFATGALSRSVVHKSWVNIGSRFDLLIKLNTVKIDE